MPEFGFEKVPSISLPSLELPQYIEISIRSNPHCIRFPPFIRHLPLPPPRISRVCINSSLRCIHMLLASEGFPIQPSAPFPLVTLTALLPAVPGP